MTYIIIFLTVIVSIAALRNRTLFDRLSLVPYRVVHDRQWWRVITHGFVHGDYVHLAVNMFVLLSFGQFIERFSVHTSRSGWFPTATYGTCCSISAAWSPLRFTT